MNTIQNIRELRVHKKIKQKEFADLCGLTIGELMKIERGLAPINNRLLTKLSDVLDLTSNDIEALKGNEIDAKAGEGYVTAVPKASLFKKRAKEPNLAKKPVIDLFCGVGGFSSGFEQQSEYQVVAGVDLLGDRLDTFSKNHPYGNSYGQDIREITADTILQDCPKPFVVVGGPPCQGFSSIRPFRNVEWNDQRNNLGEEYVRIVAGLKPEWVVFENVVGLLTFKGGAIVEAILDALREIGYRAEAKVLNAANYGVPQRRERLIIVGSLKGKRFKWPKPTHFVNGRSMAGNSRLLLTTEQGLFSEDLPPAITLIDAIGDLPALASGEKASSYCKESSISDYQKFIRNKSEKLTLHEATKHSEKMLEIIRHAGSSIRDLPPGMVTSGFSSCYSRLAANEPSVTLTVNFVHPASNRCIHPYQDRALTPREGARLQGFFDTFEFSGSKAQTVKQIGNAVPPILGHVIARAILNSE